MGRIDHAIECPPWLFSVEGAGAHQSESDFKDDTGGFSVDRWFLSAGIEFAGELKLKDAFDVTIEESKYDPAPIFGGSFEFRF